MNYMIDEETLNRILNSCQLFMNTPEEIKPRLKAEIQIITSNILVYCNRQDFPMALELTVAKMVCDMVSNMQYANLTSIKQGDTTLTFANPNTLKSKLEELAPILRPWRKLKVVW